MNERGQRAVDELMDRVEALREQRDTLLAACKLAIHDLKNAGQVVGIRYPSLNVVVRAIAKAEGRP